MRAYKFWAAAGGTAASARRPTRPTPPPPTFCGARRVGITVRPNDTAPEQVRSATRSLAASRASALTRQANRKLPIDRSCCDREALGHWRVAVSLFSVCQNVLNFQCKSALKPRFTRLNIHRSRSLPRVSNRVSPRSTRAAISLAAVRSRASARSAPYMPRRLPSMHTRASPRSGAPYPLLQLCCYLLNVPRRQVPSDPS